MAHILNYAPGCAGLGEPGRGTSGLGEVWHGGAWLCTAWLGRDSRGFAPALCSIFTNSSQIMLARSGKAWSGAAWHGEAKLVKVAGRNPCFIFKHHKTITNYIVARSGSAVLG